MIPSAQPLLLLLATALLASCSSLPAAAGAGPAVAHDVFFTLRDAGPEARAALVADCYGSLAGLPGVLELQAGERLEDATGEVNDTGYDVALRVLFEDRAALEAYAVDPAHLAFIERQRGNWAAVRVFDTRVLPR